jgi:hypothetical protein
MIYSGRSFLYHNIHTILWVDLSGDFPMTYIGRFPDDFYRDIFPYTGL